MDRLTFGKKGSNGNGGAPPIQFGLHGPRRPPVRGFDFGRGMERERMGHGPPPPTMHHGGPERDVRGGPDVGGRASIFGERSGAGRGRFELSITGFGAGLRLEEAAKAGQKL